MKNNKLILIVALTLALAFIGFASPVKAFADTVYENEYQQAFFENYESVCQVNVAGGYSATNALQYYQASGNGLQGGEQAEALSEGFLTTYRNEYEVLMVAYKNVCKYMLDNSFNLSDYAPTENGVVLVNTKLQEAKTAISQATCKQEVDVACQTFIDFISGGTAVKNNNVLVTEEGASITASVATTAKVFSPDDVLSVKKFADSVITKNLKLALLDSTELTVNEGGVAYYFSVKWLRNGVIVEDRADLAVTFTVSLEDMGLTVENGAPVQIARYLGNGNVAFTSATVDGGNLIFSLTGFGGDIESKYDLDFAVVLEGYALESRGFVYDNWQTILIVLAGIVVIYLISKMVKTAKKGKMKKEFKAFKKERKLKKKQAKQEKKAKQEEKEVRKVKPQGGSNKVTPASKK
ncbi:MAG: hypothetical protein IKL82_01165 [Clostridia bacterium]|nr:hypothetical protein [Clostridia bacterium]